MRNKRVLIAVSLVVAAMVVLAGGLLASNMGFKLNKKLLEGDGGTTSKTGTQTIALPYNRQVGIDTAKDLMIDIGVSDASNVQRYLTKSDTTQQYTFGTPNFNLEEGESYFVKMNNEVDYIIVGSHNPAAVLTLIEGDGGTTSKTGTQMVALPYHAVVSTAKEWFLELGVSDVSNIQRYLTKSDTTQQYTFGLADFALNPGEGYFVKMNNTINYSPSHY